jgi:predicted ATPase
MTQPKDESFYRGAEWVRMDCHLHTRADKEFKYSGEGNAFNAAYVDALERAGIRLGVITNHNKFDYQEFKSLRAAAKKRRIGLLPGVELSVNDGANGIHTLIVFSDEWVESGEDHITPFLHVAFEGKIPSQFEQENGRTTAGLLEIIRKLEMNGRDFFIIFAHVEQNSGLWNEIEGGRLTEIGSEDCFRRRTLGFQKVRTHDGAGKGGPSRVTVKHWLKDWYPAEVEGSDPKSIDEIGKGEICCLKLGELSFEAVKFALFDYEYRVRQKLPDLRKLVALREIRFEGGILNGKSIPFSDALNCLIGPRGNGKSAVIECLRYALGLSAEADENYKSALVKGMLTSSGKVIVSAVDEFGRNVRVERESSGPPSVYLDEKYQEVRPGVLLKDMMYFGQKDLSARSESFDGGFLDKLLADRVSQCEEEEDALIESVREAVVKLKDVMEASSDLEGLRKEEAELKVSLKIYEDKGVGRKLAEMTEFDSDISSIEAWERFLVCQASELTGLGEWDNLEAAFPVLKSGKTKSALNSLTSANSKFDEAKTSFKSSVKSMDEAIEYVREALRSLAPVRETIKMEVKSLQLELNEPQLDLELFREKNVRLKKVRLSLENGGNREEAEKSARDCLGAALNKLHDHWLAKFREREIEVSRIANDLPPDIQISIVYKGNKAAFAEFLRMKFKGKGLQQLTYDKIVDAFIDGRELYQGRDDLEKKINESACAKVRDLLLEELHEFLTFRTPDTTAILFRGKPLAEYSLGQRATVILRILMHLRNRPVIIIDQPEDDLDNETLYSHFIKQLLVRKESAQFIFATHNPNVPVLGDVDQAIVCRKDGETFSFISGSIDAKDIQGRIITVMEGGKDAFRRRKDIYEMWRGLS